MAFPLGTRLGPYEIAAPLGAGGMGEVYRARDTRLGRDVALKVLPASGTGDAAARERFEREARLIASLQHPHICVLHDVGHAGDTPYLVMELLAGETLDARLARGRLPLDEALAIAAQIAQALDAAHRHGIVHRDLKPANVMLQKATGASAAVDVKLLDFGVAKPVHREMRAGDETGAIGAATAASLTDQHTLVGTLPYMAPEQLGGQPADARTDLWALGCVLYEMLTGTRPFKGETTVRLMAAILEHPPAPLPERAPLTPPLVDHLVARCLEKDPERRWQSARDVALELEWARAHAAGPIAAPRPRKSTFPILGGVAAGAAITAVLGFAAWPSRSAAPLDTLTGAMIAAEDGRIEINHGEVKFSADGRALAVTVIGADGSSRIWLYSLDGSPAVPVAGTEGGRGPAFSRDGRWLAFTAGGRLQKVPSSGGTPVALADAGHMHGAAWSADDRYIYYPPEQTTGIMRVPASGGPPEQVTRLDPERAESTHEWPSISDDGQTLAYTVNASVRTFEDSRIVMQPVGGGAARTFVENAIAPRFDDEGRLFYVDRNGTLIAARLGTDGIDGGPQPLRAQVLDIGGNGVFDVSRSGLLAFARGMDYRRRRVAVIGRDGKEIVRSDEQPFLSVAATPAADRVAVVVSGGRVLTADAGNLAWSANAVAASTAPIVWTRDNQHVVYSPELGRLGAFTASGLPGPIDIRDSGAYMSPLSWTPDGLLLFRKMVPNTRGWGLLQWQPGAAGVGELVPTLERAALIAHAAVEPTRRLIAYATDAGGRYDVLVRSFDDPEPTLRVSTGASGMEPYWSTDGRRLLFATGRTLLSAEIGTSPLRVGPLVPVPGVVNKAFSAGNRRTFSILPGDRIAYIVEGDSGLRDRLVIHQDWRALLPQDAASPPK